MSDTIVARGAESKYTPHSEGQFVAQCVDTIDLGEKVQDFPGTTPYLAPTCALVFRTGEKNEATGEYIDIAKEYTVSMGEKANLRKDLTQWRGKPYTPEQVKAGVPLDKLTGNFALITVTQRESGKGRLYANITAIVGLPKQMQSNAVSYDDYTRADYWATKKTEYATAAAAFKGKQGPAAEDYSDLPPIAPAEDDDLPFN